MKKDDKLLEGLDFDEETQKFTTEDDARTYDFRTEARMEKSRIKDPNYLAAKALAELLIELSEIDDGARFEN